MKSNEIRCMFYIWFPFVASGFDIASDASAFGCDASKFECCEFLDQLLFVYIAQSGFLLDCVSSFIGTVVSYGLKLATDRQYKSVFHLTNAVQNYRFGKCYIYVRMPICFNSEAYAI